MRDVKKSTPARTSFRPSYVQKFRGLTSDSEGGRETRPSALF